MTTTATKKTPNLIEQAKERFQRDTRNHTLHIRHESGLYRHLIARDPNHGFFWFEVVTWPGGLTIRGDLGHTYTFTGATDMLTLFRAFADAPNPHYWAQKVEGGTNATTDYDPRLLRAALDDHIQQVGTDDLFDRTLACAQKYGITPDRLPQNLLDECVAASRTYMDGLRAAVHEHFYSDWSDYNLDYEAEAHRAIDTFQYKPKDAPDAEEPFHFTDWHEWNLRDHSEWFLIACHAVVWAITRYDQARTKTATTGQ